MLAIGIRSGSENSHDGDYHAVGRGGMGILITKFIQTDATINMGNSGGALVDTGRLSGINSAIFSRSGGARESALLFRKSGREVTQSLRDKGRVVRGYIGSSVKTLTPEIADAMKLKGQSTGALVGEVEPNAPACKSRHQNRRDVITAVNAKKVNDPRELRLMIGSMAPGTKTHIEVQSRRSEQNV